jgi:uncharacterized protein with beta-barrel porin domain
MGAGEANMSFIYGFARGRRSREGVFLSVALAFVIWGRPLGGIAWADGGAGGGFGSPGGAGGTGFNGAAGGAGGQIVGGGGGGAGGGVGGAGGDNGGAGGTGGTGGTSLTPNGTAGNFGHGGGGGGGGGYNGNGAGTATITNTTPLVGGNGGNGGDYNPNLCCGGGGGGGGAGGYGAVVTGSGSSSNSSTITGGNGGDGGAGIGGVDGGAGGDGGVGLVFAAPGNTFTNTGTVSGGNGGAGPGATGNGGIGIVGAGLTIVNTGGTIIGGTSGGGVQNYAIQFTGGTNAVGPGGTINGGIDVAAGSFMPALAGSTVGTPLFVTGPFVFASGTQYVVRITPTANDSVVDTGQANLGGATVSVVAGNGTYTVGTRTIFTATLGLHGTTFSGVSSNLAFLTPTLSYDSTNVFLTVAAGTTDAPGIVTTNPATGETTTVPNYRSAASSTNQLAVADALTNAGVQNGGTGKVLTALNQLTVPQAQAALDGLSGQGITAAQNLAYASGAQFNSAIFDQTTFYGPAGTGNSVTLSAPQPGFFALAPAQDDGTRTPIHELADLPSASHQPIAIGAAQRTWRAWASGFGGVEDLHGAAGIGTTSQNTKIYGGAIGVDYQLTQNYLVGIALGGSDGEFTVPGLGTSGSTTGGHIAFYDIANFGAFYGASSTAFSYYTNKTTRFIGGFGGLAAETERGTFDSHEFRSRLEFGRHFDAPTGLGFGGSITPFVALELAELRSNGFAETALSGPGLLGLTVSGQSQASAPSFIGARFQGRVALGDKMVLSPILEGAYVHEFAPQRSEFGALTSLPGATFLVDGARSSRDAAHVKAGAEITLGAASILFANFDGEFSGTSEYYGGKGGFKVLW